MDSIIPDISRQLDAIIAGLSGILPELVLVVTFLVAIFSGLFLSKRWPQATFYISIGGILIAALLCFFRLSDPEVGKSGHLFLGMIISDQISLYVRLLIAGVCLLFCLFVQQHGAFRSHRKKTDDLFSILLAIQIGLNLMAMSVNWLMAYIAIEMVSIGSYLLVGYLAKEARQAEASIKYALFGSVCSAVMLYGLSLIYGFTGSLDFTSATHLQRLLDTAPAFLLLALLFVFTGVGFKLSLVPFHFWTPDVYQGAPTPVTAFLSTAPKIAGMILLTRILFAWPDAGLTLPDSLYWLLVVAAIATMLLGNLAALKQHNVKRMMAYSSIGHTGFLLMTVLAYPQDAYQVLFFYLLVYSLMNMAVFMMAGYLEEQTGAADLDHYQGLGKSHSIVLVCMVVVLISLTGLPPTGGFMAKLLAFSAVYNAWQVSGHAGLLLMLVTGALSTVISLFFYFKIPLQAFLRDRKADLPPLPSAKPIWLIGVILVLTAAIVLLGIYPQLFR